MTLVVAVEAGGNDVIGFIRAPFGTGLEMFGSATQGIQRRLHLASLSWKRSNGIIPHRQVAIITEAPLCYHLILTDILQCAHGTSPPFNFVRSECAASQRTLPGRKLLLARDPIVRGSAVRIAKSEI